MIVRFDIIGEPKGKGRHRAAVVGGKIRTYTPAETASYENLVKVMYMQQVGNKRLTGAIQANITAFYKVPKSWAKKRKQSAAFGEERPQTKPDCDNIAKIILDALNGIAYEDDKQVVCLSVNKYYSENTQAFVTVQLMELDKDNF